jgi:hypothetical protein
MMHERRRWVLNPVASAEELAEMLTQRTWTLCSGFYVVGHQEYLFLNDATCEDGACEYAVIHEAMNAIEHAQIESITFSWCSREIALRYIRQTLAGEYDLTEIVRPINLVGKLDTPEQHKRCHRCA